MYEGTGWEHEAPHAEGWSHKAYSIAFIGTFTDRPPNEASLQAFRELVSCEQPEVIGFVISCLLKLSKFYAFLLTE